MNSWNELRRLTWETFCTNNSINDMASDDPTNYYELSEHQSSTAFTTIPETHLHVAGISSNQSTKSTQ